MAAGEESWLSIAAGFVRDIVTTIGCLIVGFVLLLVVLLVVALAATPFAKHELGRVSLENPRYDGLSLAYDPADPASRDGRKGFKAYLIEHTDLGVQKARVFVGEGAGDLYRYTYWVDADHVNACALAGRIKDGAAFKIMSESGVERTITVSTRCAPRASLP